MSFAAPINSGVSNCPGRVPAAHTACGSLPPPRDRAPLLRWKTVFPHVERRPDVRKPLVRLLFFLAASLFAVAAPVAFTRGEVKVICVARRPMDPSYPHDVLSGVETLLTGVARSDGPALTECAWDFGDGTRSERKPLDDPLALEVGHVYTGEIGRIFKATLTVWDDSGASGSDGYYVRIRPDTPRTRAHIACDLALWNIHKRMQREENGGVAVGYWESPGKSHRTGITAPCIQAFENLGHFPFDDPEESPYVDDVRKALNQLLLDMKPASLSQQNAGNPDLNGNGIGLYCHHEESLKHIFSSQGLAMMALVMSRDPERVATVGGPHLIGRKFVDIVQDMVEFLAFGQTDDSPEGIVARGGWRYDRPNSGEADMVCTEWAVSGMMAAETNWGSFGIRIPPWVKTELRDNFLVAARDAGTGGWLYLATPTSHVNVGLTATGILCSAWTGLPPDDPMVQSGLAYIAANWDWEDPDASGLFGHFTSLFNMYAVTNAMRTYGFDAIGDHPWYREYADYLIATQKPDGSWASKGYESDWPLAAAWAVLILLKPQTPPSVELDELGTAQQGPVTLTYTLSDANYDECDLFVEFSTDDGLTWNPATQAGGDSLTFVEAPPEGLPRSFVWDTIPDIGKTNVDNVRVRIVPYDGERGEAGEIVLPGVYNDVVPFEPVEVPAPPANGRGVAPADFDQDGDLDVFVANFGQEDFLFRNDAGVFVESASPAGIRGTLPSTCGVWGDFNGDGAIDLYLVLAGEANRLYSGNGDGTFTEVASQLRTADTGGGMSAAWGDYDNDNRLDLYVANDPAWGSGANCLYRNMGDHGFVSLAGLLNVNCPLATRSATWCDFDADGRSDLYLANGLLSPGQESNVLFHNTSVPSEISGSFEEVSADAGVADPRDSAAAVSADFNNDGLFDIYLVNAGSEENVLYLNNGDGTFRDETARAGLHGPPDATGAAVADFDNDGDLDLFVSANGRNALYMNRGDCTFADVALLVGMDHVADSRGAAWGDLDGDGFLDLYVANDNGKDILYRNGRATGNWLCVQCLTDDDGDATDEDYADDRDAIGAVIEVDLDGNMNFSSDPPDRLEVQRVDGGSGGTSQGQLWPHFGLGGHAVADVRVTFPDGSVVYRCGVSANQKIVVRDIAPTGDFYVQVFTPEVPRSGRIAIGYMLFSSEEKECEIVVEYSSDGGQTWHDPAMGQGGEGTAGLLSSPSGVLHTYLWDSVRNLGYSNSDSVRIRITPYGPDPGQSGETSDFSVYNNTPPRAVVETPSGIGTGEIPIRYTLTDTQSDDCTIFVEYSTNPGGSWRMAAAGPGGDGTVSLSSTPDGVLHTYVWDSFASIGHAFRDDLKIRITPSDKQGRGIPGETGPFIVDNNLPPAVSVETPAFVQKGNVLLNYRLLDAESDWCSVRVLYSLDGGRTWLSASMGPGGEDTSGLTSAPSGESHSYVWDSLKDFGNDYSAVARMMMIPEDAKNGAPAQTGDFVVDNLRPAELAFSPSSFTFTAQEGGEPPSPQTLEVWNTGHHSLVWTAATDAGWLIVHPVSGASSGEKDVINVSVDIAGLSSGTYLASITLTAPDAIGSPAYVPVTLELSPPPPSLFVQESLLSFRASEGGADPSPQFLHIRNAGGRDMPWQAQADRDWIILFPDSGSSAGETDTVEVRVEVGELPVGLHTGTITVSAPNAANSPHLVAVSLEVLPAPRELTVVPRELSFVTRRGGPNPPEQELRLTISGFSEAAWQANVDAAWLSLSPSSGTNSGEETVIRVGVEKAGLDIGSYRAEVVFTAPGVHLAPQNVLVTLDIVPIIVPDDFPSIQEAINEAKSLDVIRVKPGLYRENIVMKDGIELIGDGDSLTTIRAEQPSSVVVFQDIQSARLEGFTVSGGIGDFFGREDRVGGGIYFANSSATISRCVIAGNSASWGGGLCVDKSSNLIVEDSSISANTAACGGALFCYENCQALLLRTRVFDNAVTQYGGAGCAASAASIVLKSCEVFCNSADLGGGGIFAAPAASLQIVNCTIADNVGEGILAAPASSASISNTILWANTTDLSIPSGQSVCYCDIESDGFAGKDGNISEHPSFVASGEGCYDLLPNSPCIDAGSNTVAGLPASDVHGQPRTVAAAGTPVTDIGADEHDPQTVFVLVEPEPQPGPAGEVTVPFSLWNRKSLPVSLVVEFSVGGSVWRAATRAGGEGTTDLTSSPAGSPHSFVWDSVPDLKGELVKSVRIRMRLPNEDVRPGATTAPFSLDNTLSDSDNDGLPDAWEEAIVQADPDDDIASIADVSPDGDPDDDLSDNLTEYLARTDPLDSESNFRARCIPGDGLSVVIHWRSVAGRFYQVYRCSRMGETWAPFGPKQTGTGGDLSVVDDTVTENSGQGYYAVKVE